MRKKLMIKFASNFKKPYFWSILVKNGLLTPFQNLEKTESNSKKKSRQTKHSVTLNF